MNKLLLLAALFLFACVTPLPPPGDDVIRRKPAAAPLVTISLAAADRDLAPAVESAVVAGLRIARRWGELTSPIRVVVYPDHEAFERAIRRESPWIRAWATERSVALDSPRRWLARLEELLAHELTHVVHYQVAGMKASASRRNDPFWFREGLASVSAGEESSRLGGERLAAALARRPDLDIRHVTDPDTETAHLAYSCAHRLVEALLDEHGDDAIRRILAAIRGGTDFDTAFRDACGMTPRAFVTARMAVLRGDT